MYANFDLHSLRQTEPAIGRELAADGMTRAVMADMTDPRGVHAESLCLLYTSPSPRDS